MDCDKYFHIITEINDYDKLELQKIVYFSFFDVVKEQFYLLETLILMAFLTISGCIILAYINLKLGLLMFVFAIAFHLLAFINGENDLSYLEERYTNEIFFDRTFKRFSITYNPNPIYK
jgi:cellulose synthase/poly-beta-1,6-N-acetylglucosamine synthase-like glycosyltransferase